MSGGSAAAICDAHCIVQGLAAEEAKVGAQCDKTDGTTVAVICELAERDGDARRRFLSRGMKKKCELPGLSHRW